MTTFPDVGARALLVPLVLATLAGTARAQDTQPASSAVASERRAAAISIAERYAAHRWTASETNRLHGPDLHGVHVDTPDQAYVSTGWTAGSEYVGVPYAWGGSSTLDEFDAGIARGFPAGHLPKGRGSAGSGVAVGVDCSGLITRCWDLPVKQSTATLPALCYELASYDELEPGDAINRPSAHVMLFKEWATPDRTRVRVIEAVTPRVKESEHAVADLIASGFSPLRYRPLDARWANESVAFVDPTFEVERSVAQGEWTSSGPSEEIARADLPGVLTVAPQGAWISLTSSAPDEPFEAHALGVVSRSETGAELHARRTHGSSAMDETTGLSSDEDLLLRWLQLPLPEAPRARLELRALERRPGKYAYGGRTFEAHEYWIDSLLTFDVGSGRTIPVDVEMTVYASADVPLLQLLAATHRVTIDYGDAQPPTVVEGRTTLLAYRDGR